MTLIPGGRNCYCGKKGCAECYCSATALLEENLTLEEFFARKETGDAACLKKWEAYLEHLALLINNLHSVLENTVILGGHVTPYFTEADIARLQNKVSRLSSLLDSPSYILTGECRYDAVSIGSALPFVKEFLQKSIL